MDVSSILAAVLHSPQLLGMVMTVIAANLHNFVVKVAPPDAKTKVYLQLVYLALSGLVFLLDKYMNGGLGDVSQDAIKNALDVYTSMITAHFVGGKLVDEAKVEGAKLKAKLGGGK